MIHWLDVAGYADSDGYVDDGVRPYAFKYRDYVIRAFNDDKPYDRFLLEQLAGDELDEVTPETIIATGTIDEGINTGFESTPTTLEGLRELMESGSVYVNVHTQNFGLGEIRGQIVAVP